MAGVSRSEVGQAGPPVAFLDVRHAAYEYDGRDSESRKQIPVHDKDEFCIGRNSPQLEYVHDTVSKRHVRFHCFLFEEGGQWSISPLVYAEDLSTNGTYLKRAQALDEDQPDSRGIPMRSTIRITLLEENDELWLAPTVFLRYHVANEYKGEDPPFSPAVQTEMKVICYRYQVKRRKIGEGGHGAVHVAVHRKTQRQLACKIVALDTVREQQNFSEERLTQEFDILRTLDHPNIIRLEKVFHSHSNLYIFQELVSGGDLFSFMDKSYRLGIPAIEAAVIVQQILKGVDYLHDHGIVHRDLKPDNILLASTRTASRVIITDFGQARYLPDSEHPTEDINRRMKTLVGTLGFNAPEVYRWNPTISPGGGYSKAVDMWSVGCITSHLLSGTPIFNGSNEQNAEFAIKSRSSKCNLDILDNDPVWQKVGRRAKDFIKKTLVLNENDRLTAKEALEHEWFSNPVHVDELTAVYQHAVKDWEPRKKVFRLVEFINSPRPNMILHHSRYFDQSGSSNRDYLPEHFPSRFSPVMPSIEEEPDGPHASPIGSQATTQDDCSEIPGPPESYLDAVPNGSTSTQDSVHTDISQQPLTPTQLLNPGYKTQKGPSPMQSKRVVGNYEANLTPTQLFSLANMQPAAQMLHEEGPPMPAAGLDAYIPGPPTADPESISQEITQLSLTDQQNDVMMNNSPAMKQHPDDPKKETASFAQKSNMTTLGKRPPTFDFDEGIDDADFQDLVDSAELTQTAVKRSRIV